MISALLYNGTSTDANIVNEILKHEKETFPRLAEIILDVEFWDTSKYDTMAAICAMYLLISTKSYQALLVINTALMTLPKNFIGSQLIGSLITSLAYMKSDVIPIMVAFLRHDDVDLLLRFCMVNTLIIMGKKYPQQKVGIIASIKDAVENVPDIEMRELLLFPLKRLNDPDIDQYLDELFENSYIGADLFELQDHDIKRIFGLELEFQSPVDPLFIFTSVTMTRKKFPKSTSILEPRNVQKIGRNDPCPCGSGRKYKKCCMSVTS